MPAAPLERSDLFDNPLGTNDIFAAVEAMRGRGVRFQETPDTYYEQLGARVPGHARACNGCAPTASCWTGRRRRARVCSCRSSRKT